MAATMMACLAACAPADVADPTPTVPVSDWTPVQATKTDTVPQFWGQVPSNLLFISLDTFRKDKVAAHGGTGLTPFLDQLMAEGFVLDDHQQCSNWTYASTTCTLLGRTNVENGFMPKLSSVYREPVPDGTPFLAHWLKGAGFYSVLVSSNSWLSEEWNNDQGFDESELPGNRNATNCFEVGVNRVLDAHMRGDITDRWFLHLHFKEPHPAYSPPDDYLTGLEGLEDVPWDLDSYDAHYESLYSYDLLSEEERALLEAHLQVRYDGEVAYLDDQLRDMFDVLQDYGMLHDTLVVFWTDHGEQFWEHGDQGHAYSLHGEENDGIAFFWSQNIVADTHTAPTSAIDLVPTVLGLYDQPIPAEVTGYPVGEAPPDRPRFGESEARVGPVQSVTVGGVKLQFWWDGELNLYDRNVDPLESKDLYDPEDPRVAELWALLEPMVRRAEPLIDESTVTWPQFD